MNSMAPKTKDAYRLMHEGILALAEIERNGIWIDEEYLQKQDKILQRKIDRLTKKLNESEEVKLWKKVYGSKFKLSSNPQLGDILFNHLGLTPAKTTDKGKPSVDEGALQLIDSSLVRNLLKIRKLKKNKDTYLGGLVRETDRGKLHPFFNLHTVKTFRSSSSNINFQNIPKRDPEVMRMIRRAFLPSAGHRIGGVDYSGCEVRVACCYHKDPEMIKYIEDPSTDMHRDTAMDCYLLEQEEVSGKSRYASKNKFVFPQFYGDYYVHCANNLWKSIDDLGLTKPDGTPLKDHLAEQGIKSYQKFENHIKDVEYKFWYEKFDVYRKWKEKWVKRYEKKGYIDTLTGFRCQGFMGKNDVINYPVQGSAFHCLLWSLIELQKWMKREKTESQIIGQIHDELSQDLCPDEFDFILKKERKVMCEDIREMWPWLIVPLEVEFSFAEVDEPWSETVEVEI